MPNRILRDGILESEAVCSLPWPAEVFYRRLMSVVDDYGRFHATPKLIRARCYPLQIDKVSDADIGKWLAQVAEAGLVSVYPAADGKRYLEVVKFGQQVRAKSKFPAPSDGACGTAASNCYQPIADAHLDGVVFGDVGEVGGEGEEARENAHSPPEPKPARRTRAPSIQAPEGVEAKTWADWLHLRKTKRAPVTETVVQGALIEAEKAGLSLDAFLRIWCTRGSQGLQAEWLKPSSRPGGNSSEPEWAREKRERIAAFAGPAAAKPRGQIIDMEGAYANAKRLG